MKYARLEDQALIVWHGCCQGRKEAEQGHEFTAAVICNRLDAVAQAARHQSLSRVARGGAVAIENLVNELRSA